VRRATWAAAAVWLGSWFLMYLEITRWHHVRPTLALNPPEIRGTALRAHPGLPLIALYGACAVAPLITVAGAVKRLRSERAVAGPVLHGGADGSRGEQ
jgi:hypothetical protein